MCVHFMCIHTPACHCAQSPLFTCLSHTRSPSSDVLTSLKDTEVSGATDCPKPRQWLWPGGGGGGGVSKQDIILRLFTVINSLQTGQKASHRIARHMLVLHI